MAEKMLDYYENLPEDRLLEASICRLYLHKCGSTVVKDNKLLEVEGEIILINRVTKSATMRLGADNGLTLALAMHPLNLVEKSVFVTKCGRIDEND